MRISSICSALAGFIFLLATPAFAETPNKLEGTTLVNAKEAKEIVDSKKTAIVDTRIKVEFAEEHLPGAVNVTYGEKSAKDVNYDASKDSFDVAKLPADKSQPLLVYCNGPECWKSYKAAKAVIKAGYKTVYWFRTGIPDWKKSGFATEK